MFSTQDIQQWGGDKEAALHSETKRTDALLSARTWRPKRWNVLQTDAHFGDAFARRRAGVGVDEVTR